MYIPAPFDVTDTGTLYDIIEQHPFGLLIAGGGDTVDAAHIPFLHDRDRGTLRAHVARANPIWKALDGAPALAIFNGPHAYVSPDWYGADGLVPTWNYLAVHVRGTARLLQEDETRTLLEALTDRGETGIAGKAPWQPDRLPADLQAKLLRALVGFEIRIDRLEGKAKLSQNRTAAERQGVIRALDALGGDDNRAIAALMAMTI